MGTRRTRPAQLPSWFLSDDGPASRHGFVSRAATVAWCPAVAPAATALSAAERRNGSPICSAKICRLVAVCCLASVLARSGGVTADVFRRREAVTRSTTDAGSLIGQSPSALGLGVQRRNPIVNDPRIRGHRIGSLPASRLLRGSGADGLGYDAQQDRLPDSQRRDHDQRPLRRPVRSGLLLYRLPNSSPRPVMEEAFQAFGSTGFDCKVNGEQWSGRQTVWGGAADWGFRAGYGHRTGNDYTAGDGQHVRGQLQFAGSWMSRSAATSTPGRHVEFRELRLDQTGVELPGQAFDIDLLYADGYELTDSAEDQSYADLLTVDAWYNRTRLDGNAQNALSNGCSFPTTISSGSAGVTDVDSMSNGLPAGGDVGSRAGASI